MTVPIIGYLITLYQRALAQKALTPAERAFLKSIEGAVMGAVASTLIQFPSLLTSHQYNGLLTIAFALSNALLLSLSKLYTANGDALVGAVLQKIEEELAAREGQPPAQ